MKFKDVYPLLKSDAPVELWVSDYDYSPIKIEYELLDEFTLDIYGEYQVRFISGNDYGLCLGLKLIK